MKLLINTLFLLVLWSSLTACNEIDGGAVEIAWVIRGSDNQGYSCEDEKLAPFVINKIKLIIKGTEGEYDGVDICESGLVKNCVFECDSTFGGSTFRGVTSFSVPSGTYHIGIQPLDSKGNPISKVQVETPSLLRKTIDRETITFMGVWQMVINLNNI
ncbi:MAG: hypothetical protein ACQES9_11930 [Myxococcota bacterium]